MYDKIHYKLKKKKKKETKTISVVCVCFFFGSFIITFLKREQILHILIMSSSLVSIFSKNNEPFPDSFQVRTALASFFLKS